MSARWLYDHGDRVDRAANQAAGHDAHTNPAYGRVRPPEVCTCKPGDGSVICEFEDYCYGKWCEQQAAAK